MERTGTALHWNVIKVWQYMAKSCGEEYLWQWLLGWVIEILRLAQGGPQTSTQLFAYFDIDDFFIEILECFQQSVIHFIDFKTASIPSPLLLFILNLTTATHCTIIFKVSDNKTPEPPESRSCCRPLSHRIPPLPPAGSLPRRRRRKKFGAPPGQPKFMDAAAAVFFSAHRGASEKWSRC